MLFRYPYALQALLHAELSEELRYLLQATIGVVALGTPFRGTKMQFIAKFGAYFMSLLGSDRGILRDLIYNNDILKDRLHEFCLIRDRYSIPACCFFELYKTDYGRRFGLPGVLRGTVRIELR